MRYQGTHTQKNSLLLRGLISWVLLLVGTLLVSAWLPAQEENPDALFLDDSFIDGEENGNEGEQAPAENDFSSEQDKAILPFQNDLIEGAQDEEKGTLLSTFSIRDTISYYATTQDTAQNKGDLMYYSPWGNVLFFNHFLQYKTSSQRFRYKMNYNLYFDARLLENTTKIQELDTGFAFEQREINIAIDILPYSIIFRVGKILQDYGLGYLTSPSTPSLFSYKSKDFFAKNRVFHTLSTTNIAPLVRSKGSDTEMGYWATELEINFFPITWRIAYLPKFDTGFIEIDRPYHSMLTMVKVSAWDYIQPSALLYWYDKNFFTGLTISLGLNEYLTAHIDLGISSENELPAIQKISEVSYGANTSIAHYELTPREIEGIYTELLFGINYTPVYKAMALFNMILEFYYNGKGFYNDDWDAQINLSQDIYVTYHDVKNNSSIASLSSAYKGILGYKQYYYTPLSVRPFYAMVRISRDDIFPSLQSKYNAETSIVYSVYDTTFAWRNNIEVEMKDMISIGTTIDYYFGLPYGSFTELPYKLQLSVYSEFHF